MEAKLSNLQFTTSFNKAVSYIACKSTIVINYSDVWYTDEMGSKVRIYRLGCRY